MRNEKLVHSRPDYSIDLKRIYLPKHVGDNKYVERMVPGYTGSDFRKVDVVLIIIITFLIPSNFLIYI